MPTESTGNAVSAVSDARDARSSAIFGIALSGGGARGIAHIGALRAMEAIRIPVDRLAGTSMGAIIAGMYAAGYTAAELTDLARSLRLLDVVERDETGLALLGHGKMARRLRDALGGEPTFADLQIPLVLTAVDLYSGELVLINEGSVIDAMLASAAFPGVFPPVKWNGRHLIDGGVLNPVPLDVVREMGADRVIAVYVTGEMGPHSAQHVDFRGQGFESIIRLLLNRTRWNPLMNIADRSLNIMSAKLVEQLVRESPPDILIDVALQGVGLFDLDQVDLCLRLGEESTLLRTSELIALRDGSLPQPWRRRWRAWWRRLTTDRRA
ncbi:MAG: patatin-like phospholipase family protein [Chloroflexi bacterium]|nr:patatin-like phospholipase family protein [Chloroflexota bacterium]